MECSAQEKEFSKSTYNFLHRQSFFDGERNEYLYYTHNCRVLPFLRPLKEFEKALLHSPLTTFKRIFGDLFDGRIEALFKDAITDSSCTSSVYTNGRWIVHSPPVTTAAKFINFCHEIGHAYADNYLASLIEPATFQQIKSEVLAIFIEQIATFRLGMREHISIARLNEFVKEAKNLDLDFFLFELESTKGDIHQDMTMFPIHMYLFRESLREKPGYQAIYALSRFLVANLLDRICIFDSILDWSNIFRNIHIAVKYVHQEVLADTGKG